MRRSLAILVFTIAAACGRPADPAPYDATLFALVVPQGRVTWAGSQSWWIATPAGGPAWSASRDGQSYTFTRPDRARITATPNGRGGWTLREWPSSAPLDARRDAGGGLTVRLTNGTQRTATGGGRVVRDTATSGWADVYDLERGQYRK